MKTSHKKPTIRSEKGFTLLETVIAVTLVAMMAIGIWSVFRTGIRSWARGTENIDASHRHRIVYDMVRKQMASAFPLAVPVDPNFPDVTYPFFNGTDTSMQFVSLNSLRFQDNPGLTVVHYEASENLDEGGYSLLETEDRYLGDESASLEETDLTGSILLFDNLTNCYFEYKNSGTDENAEQETESWVREWDAQQQGQLPEAVAMVLEATDADGNVRTHQLIVPVHATEVYTQNRARNASGIRRLRGRRGQTAAALGEAAAEVLGEEGASNLIRELMLRDRMGGRRGLGTRGGRLFQGGPGMDPGAGPKIPPSGGFGPPQGGGFGPPQGGGFGPPQGGGFQSSQGQRR